MYRIFDLFIDSEVHLPELCRVDETGKDENVQTLSFHLATMNCEHNEPDWIHHWRFPDGTVAISLAREGGDYLLRFPGLADFLIKTEDHHITCFPQTGVPKETVRHLLLDQVVPRIVAHTGRIVLHASAVMIEGQAVLFVGDTGWGKSTLAASFYVNGNTLVTDDCLVLCDENGYLTGVPNYTGARLLPDSVVGVLGAERGMQGMAHYSSKKRLIVKDQHGPFTTGVPIGAVFVLGPPEINDGNNDIEIETIEGANRLIELIRHTFMLDLTDKGRVVKKMGDIGNILAIDLPMYRLSYPRDHVFLDTVRHHILQEVVAGQNYREVSAL